jgi:hypothetical protein
VVPSKLLGRSRSAGWRLAAIAAVILLTATGLRAPRANADTSSATSEASESIAVPGDREARELWTASSRTWEVAEGTYRTQLFGAPVNYQGAKGQWREIDPTLVPTSEPGFAWQNEAGPARVLFPKSLAAGGARVEQGGTWVEFSLRDAGGTASVSGSTVTYADVYPGVSVIYEVVGDGLKESLILAGPDSQRTFSFDVRQSSGVTLKAASDGSVDVVDESGTPQFRVAPPYMVDSATADAAQSDAVSMALESSAGDEVMSVDASSKWLDAPERVWPVIVDPTVMLDTTGGRDCYINESAPTDSYCAANRVKVGMSNQKLRRGLLYFDPSGIPGTMVEDAQLDLWCDLDASPPTKIEVQVRRATVDRPAGATTWKQWNDTTSWNKRAGNTAWMSGGGGDFGSTVYALRSLNCSAASGYKVWSAGTSGHTMTELVQKWVEGSQSNEENDGVVLRTLAADESTSTVLQFYSGETAHPPVLEVTSSRPSGLEGGGFQNAIAVNPTDANIVVSGGDVAGVHLSRDGGVTWTSQDTGIPDQQHLKVAALAWADATTLYALVGNGGSAGGVLRGTVETNEANVVNGVWITWAKLTGSPVGNGGDPNPGTGSGLPGDPALPQLKARGADPSTALKNPKLLEHPRSVGRLLVVDASRDALYVGAYKTGLWRATLSTITSSPNWTQIGLNAGGSNPFYIRSIDLDTSANVLFASTYRGPTGTSSSRDGQVWRVTSPSGTATATQLTGSPINVEELRVLGGTLYGVADGRDGPLSVYTDSNGTWIDTTDDAAYQRGLFQLPSAATAAVTAAWTQIFHTTTVSGTSVTRPDVSTGLMPDDTTPKNQIWFALDGYASGSNVTLWTGSRNPAPEVTGGQLIALTRLSTTNGWTSVASSDGDPQSAPPTTVLGAGTRPWWVASAQPSFMLGKGTFTASDVAIAPTSSNTIYVAGRSGVWKSSDGGANWAPAVRSMSVTINRQVLIDPQDPNNIDIGNVDYQVISSGDRMQTVSRQEASTVNGVSVGYALTRDPVSNALIAGLGARDTNSLGEVDWKNGGTWTPIDLTAAIPGGSPTPAKPIGLLAITDATSGARSVLAAVAEQGVFQSKFNTSTGSYGAFTKLTTPTMLQDSTLKRASFVQGAAGSKNVYLYDKTQGVFRGTWSYSGGTWTWTWVRILNYPSTGSTSSPAAGDGSGYVAADATSADVLWVTSGGDATHPPAAFKITDATFATSDDPTRVAVVPITAGVAPNPVMADPGPIDVDKDGAVDADGLASVVIAEPATSAHAVQLWSVNPGSATDATKWNFRELDGLTAQPLIPLDLDYDPRDGNVYMATFGIGVYTAYLPIPGPA